MSDNQQLHDTTGAPDATNEDGLPPALRDRITETLGEDANARMATASEVTVDDNKTTWEVIEWEQDGETVVWGVELSEISWQEKNRIFKDNVSQVGGSGQLQIDTYYREVAEAMIESHTLEDTMGLTTILTGLKVDVGEKLEPHLPDPVGQLEEEEAKN